MPKNKTLMDNRDQSFLNEYKPLHVPHIYDAGAPLQENVVYALAQLECATAAQVAAKMHEFEPAQDKVVHLKNANEVLGHLFNKGLIKGNDNEADRQYNLSKIRTQNSGKADSL